MKQKISLLLVCVMLLSAISAVCVFPTAAATSVDLGESPLGVQLLKDGKLINGVSHYANANHPELKGSLLPYLTENGLSFASAGGNANNGFVFDYSDHIPQDGNYTICFEMAIEQDVVNSPSETKYDYLYYGFNGFSSTTMKFDTVNNRNYLAWGTGLSESTRVYPNNTDPIFYANFWHGGGTYASPGHTYPSLDDAKYLFGYLDGKTMMRYEYKVENNKCTGFTITPCISGARTVTYGITNPMDATNGIFVMCFNAGAGGNGAEGVLENISVVPKSENETPYRVNLVPVAANTGLVKNGNFVFGDVATAAELTPNGLKLGSSNTGDGGLCFDFKSLIDASSTATISFEIAVNSTVEGTSKNNLYLGYASLLTLKDIEAYSSTANANNGIQTPHYFNWDGDEFGGSGGISTADSVDGIVNALVNNSEYTKTLKFDINITSNMAASFTITPGTNGSYDAANAVTFTADESKWAANGTLYLFVDAGTGNTVDAVLKNISFTNSSGVATRAIDFTSRYTMANKKLASALSMHDGAAIRTNTIAGIRFLSDIRKDVYEELVAYYGKDSLQLGTLIAPANYVTAAGGFTHAALDAYDADWEFDSYRDVSLPTEAWYKTAGGSYTFAGSIVGFTQPDYYTANFAAVSYLAITTGSGTVYYYSDFSTEKNVRSIKQVYDAAIADLSSGLQDNEEFKKLYENVVPSN